MIYSAKSHRSSAGIVAPFSLPPTHLPTVLHCSLQASLTAPLWLQIGAELRRTISVLGPACSVSMCWRWNWLPGCVWWTRSGLALFKLALMCLWVPVWTAEAWKQLLGGVTCSSLCLFSPPSPHPFITVVLLLVLSLLLLLVLLSMFMCWYTAECLGWSPITCRLHTQYGLEPLSAAVCCCAMCRASKHRFSLWQCDLQALLAPTLHAVPGV